jgi:hypothetical protein
MIQGKRSGPEWFWWAVHNLVAHPVSELLYWVRLKKLSKLVHDETVPIHEEATEYSG